MSTFTSTNPARPDEVVVERPVHGEADVDAAVAAAADAQRAWARTPAPARAEVIDRGRGGPRSSARSQVARGS